MQANAPEWELGRRDTLESAAERLCATFSNVGRRNVGALPRKVSSCQIGFWDDAR